MVTNQDRTTHSDIMLNFYINWAITTVICLSPNKVPSQNQLAISRVIYKFTFNFINVKQALLSQLQQLAWKNDNGDLISIMSNPSQGDQRKSRNNSYNSRDCWKSPRNIANRISPSWSKYPQYYKPDYASLTCIYRAVNAHFLEMIGPQAHGCCSFIKVSSSETKMDYQVSLFLNLLNYIVVSIGIMTS